LRRVTTRLMLPGVLAVLIYQSVSALEVFEVPGILGMPAGIYVFSTRLYAMLHVTSALPDYGKANALAMLYLVVAVVATVLYLKVINRSERYSVITGKAYRPRLTDLGVWRWPALLLPFLVMLYISFLSFLQPPSARAFHSMSWVNYGRVFDTDLVGQTLWNT